MPTLGEITAAITAIGTLGGVITAAVGWRKASMQLREAKARIELLVEEGKQSLKQNDQRFMRTYYQQEIRSLRRQAFKMQDEFDKIKSRYIHDIDLAREAANKYQAQCLQLEVKLAAYVVQAKSDDQEPEGAP